MPRKNSANSENWASVFRLGCQSIGTSDIVRDLSRSSIGRELREVRGHLGGCGAMPGLAHDATANRQDIDVRRQEAVVSVGRRADDRLPADVEAGVDHERA